MELGSRVVGRSHARKTACRLFLAFTVLALFICSTSRAQAAEPDVDSPAPCHPVGTRDFLDQCHLTQMGAQFVDLKAGKYIDDALLKAAQIDNGDQTQKPPLNGGLPQHYFNVSGRKQEIDCWIRYKMQAWADNPNGPQPDLGKPNLNEFPACKKDYDTAQEIHSLLRGAVAILLIYDLKLSREVDPVGYICDLALGKLAKVAGGSLSEKLGEELEHANGLYRKGKDYYEVVYPDNKQPTTLWGKISKLCFKY